MTIKDTYIALNAVVTSVLPSFTFYGMYKDQYNTVKSIQDYVIIIEPPRQWPINYRNTCEAFFDAKVWIGIRKPIKPATGNTYQYPPFNEIDIRDELVTIANIFTRGVNESVNLKVLGDFNGSENLVTIYDAPEGQSTNWQAWAGFTLKIGAYGPVELPDVFYPVTFDNDQLTFDNNLITFDNG